MAAKREAYTHPAVVALTCPKTKGDLIFSASLVKFALFQAGVIDVKMQGETPSSGSLTLSYHPSAGEPLGTKRTTPLRQRTDSETISVDGSPSVNTQP